MTNRSWDDSNQDLPSDAGRYFRVGIEREGKIHESIARAGSTIADLLIDTFASVSPESVVKNRAGQTLPLSTVIGSAHAGELFRLNPTDGPTVDAPPDHRARYRAAAHGMQSGVAMEIGRKGVAAAGADPKHLRTGLNSAMVEHAALVRLLIGKGLFTLEEYEEALADAMEEEKRRYERILSEELNTKVELA